jgi:ATP-dependent protease HslVU (ClpYQ) peptidase subunit
MSNSKRIIALTVACVAVQLSGCAVIAVADAVVTVGATVVKVAAKTVGAVADAVIPDSDKKKEKESK